MPGPMPSRVGATGGAKRPTARLRCQLPSPTSACAVALPWSVVVDPPPGATLCQNEL